MEEKIVFNSMFSQNCAESTRREPSSDGFHSWRRLYVALGAYNFAPYVLMNRCIVLVVIQYRLGIF
ncbi:hypothetical protein Avbf_18064, partial [Armadillidium vulgare]